MVKGGRLVIKCIHTSKDRQVDQVQTAHDASVELMNKDRGPSGLYGYRSCQTQSNSKCRVTRVDCCLWTLVAVAVLLLALQVCSVVDFVLILMLHCIMRLRTYFFPTYCDIIILHTRICCLVFLPSRQYRYRDRTARRSHNQ